MATYQTNIKFETNDDETEFSNQVAKQREIDIKNLEYHVVQVNGLFRDVAEIVQNQTPLIENIQQNVNDSLIHVESGMNELNQVQEGDATYCCCLKQRHVICFALITILIFIITVVVILAIKSNN